MKSFFLLLVLSLSLYANNMGALLFNGNCVTCHHETKAISAPSMSEITKRYKEVFPIKEEFISYMSTWVIAPKEETSIMLNAVKEYKLMPQLGYDISTLEEISSYLYNKEFQ